MRNLPHGFDIYLVNVKPIRQIAQFFVAFSEKLNFTSTYSFFLYKFVFCFSICTMEFDIILKFENLKVEQKFMIDILGLKDIIYLHKVHENSRKLTTIEKKKYYQMLDKTDLNLLIEVYKQDFYLFDYNPELYL